MRLRTAIIPVAVLLAAGGCDSKGSLGEYPETETDGGSEGESSDTSAGTATSTTSTSDPTESESSSDTAGGKCGPNFCQVYEIDCENTDCGPLGEFDENGCQRPSCLNDPDSCGEGQRCYRPQDFGGCASSGWSCADDFELEMCLCGGTDDCGGAYCVAEEDYPVPNAGPEGPMRVEDSCAPNDGPAVEFFFGLEQQSCDASLGPAPTLRINLYENPPQSGTYQVGSESTGNLGQAFWDNGDGEGPHGAFAGTVTVTNYGDTSADIEYELFFYELDGGHLGGTYEDIQYCEKQPLCG